MVIVHMQSREQVQRCLRSGEVVQRCRGEEVQTYLVLVVAPHGPIRCTLQFLVILSQRCRGAEIQCLDTEVQRCNSAV